MSPLTLDHLQPAEREAVEQAAEVMAEWREAHQVEPGTRANRGFRTGRRGDQAHKVASPCKRIDELHKRGEIDRARDARLTALAYRLSVGEEPV